MQRRLFNLSGLLSLYFNIFLQTDSNYSTNIKKMKKLVLAVVALTIAQHSNAQQAPLAIKAEVKNLKTQAQVNDGTEILPFNHAGVANHPKSQTQDFPDIILGNTLYDLQSNSSVGNRFIRNANGEMNVVWTTSQDNGTTGSPYPDRGSAYTHNYTGSWEGILSNDRIESKRTGWPCIARTASDKEVVLSHNTADEKLQVTSRTPSGTGNWIEDLTMLPSPIATGNWWPRIISGGADNNSLHALSITYPVGNGGTIYNGQNGALCYSRSTNSGSTWDKVNVVLPEMDSSSFGGFGPDDYVMDSKGDIIAFVAGGNWNDLVLMKSLDNGDTWTKTTVFQNPLPQPHDARTMLSDIDGDNVADTIYTNSGSMAVLIDNNNNCHVFFDLVRALDIAIADSSSYFPYVGAQLYHWKEGQAAYTQLDPNDVAGVIARPVDTNGNDTLDFGGTPGSGSQFPFGLYNGVGLVAHPSAGIDANGIIYLAYSAFLEGSSDGDRAYRHTYVISSVDDGDTWGEPFDIFTDVFSECVFGNMIRDVDGYVRIVYQRDGAPGHNLGTVPDPGNDVASDIVYVAVPVENGSIGINDPEVNIAGFNVYPNPASQNAQVSFTSEISGDVTLNVYNVTGELMSSFSKRVQPGITYWNIDVENFSSGIYLINALTGEQAISKKFVVR